jgi:hypothetical protein
LSLLEEADGWRYQAFATNTRVGQLAFLEARHPSREYAINQACRSSPWPPI